MDNLIFVKTTVIDVPDDKILGNHFKAYILPSQNHRPPLLSDYDVIDEVKSNFLKVQKRNMKREKEELVERQHKLSSQIVTPWHAPRVPPCCEPKINVTIFSNKKILNST